MPRSFSCGIAGGPSPFVSSQGLGYRVALSRMHSYHDGGSPHIHPSIPTPPMVSSTNLHPRLGRPYVLWLSSARCNKGEFTRVQDPTIEISYWSREVVVMMIVIFIIGNTRGIWPLGQFSSRRETILRLGIEPPTTSVCLGISALSFGNLGLSWSQEKFLGLKEFDMSPKYAKWKWQPRVLYTLDSDQTPWVPKTSPDHKTFPLAIVSFSIRVQRKEKEKKNPSGT